MTGKVVALQMGPAERGPVEALPELKMVAGAGITGDRYYQGDTPEDQRDPTLEVTVIAKEGIDAASEASGIDISFTDTRRNVLTEGIDVQSLIGKRFMVGEVEIEALADNPPCAYLQRMVGKKLLKPLMGRGGVRGRILNTGVIRVGDAVVVP